MYTNWRKRKIFVGNDHNLWFTLDVNITKGITISINLFMRTCEAHLTILFKTRFSSGQDIFFEALVRTDSLFYPSYDSKNEARSDTHP